MRSAGPIAIALAVVIEGLRRDQREANEGLAPCGGREAAEEAARVGSGQARRGGGKVKARRVEGLDPDGIAARQRRPDRRDPARRAARLRRAALEPPRATAQHDMRIAAKRLRYVLEIIESCFGEEAAVARRAVKELQSVLGDIHDCDVMLPRVDGIPSLTTLLSARREQLFRDFHDLWRVEQSSGTWTSLTASLATTADRPPARPTPTTSPTRCSASPPRRCCAGGSKPPASARPRALLRSGRWRVPRPLSPGAIGTPAARRAGKRQIVLPSSRPGRRLPRSAMAPIRRPGALLQSRALLARLQRAGAGVGRAGLGPAARAGQLLLDLRLEPRRVLHGACRGSVRPARRRDRRTRPRRARARRTDRLRSRSGSWG